MNFRNSTSILSHDIEWLRTLTFSEIMTNFEFFKWQVGHGDRNVGAPAVKKRVPRPKQTLLYRNATLNAIQRIRQKLSVLSSNYHKVSLSHKQVLSQLLEDLKLSIEMSTELWGVAHKVCVRDNCMYQYRGENQWKHAAFEVLTAKLMKIQVFLDVTLCWLVNSSLMLCYLSSWQHC